MSYCLLQRAAILFGNNTAIKNTKYKLSYSELYNLSKLMDKYVINSDKSIFVIPAQCTPFYIALIFSIIRINKIYLPVSVHEKTNNINKLCADLNAKFINLTYIARNIDITKLLNKHDTNCAQEINTESLFHNKSFTEISLEHICNYYKTIPSNIILSSGSTGEPKKIVHSISSHIYSALGGQQVFYITSTDKYLLSLPLNHVGGQAIIFKCVIFEMQDRILCRMNKPQIYGSQGNIDKNGIFVPASIEDIDKVDQRRASMDMVPLKDYIKRMSRHKK